MMDSAQPFSVLMSVYAKERPDNLDAAIKSVFDQDLVPNELVLVEDGPLPRELCSVIESSRLTFPQLRVVSLKSNVGLGAALNVGLAHCTYEFVARMDSDDLCTRDRFARQLPLFMEDNGLAVVGAWVAEFEHTPSNIAAVRAVPETPQAIARYAKRRCPVNHPAVVFRKSAVQAVGGYDAKHLQEDYYLWARLLVCGHKFRNVQAVLVLMRTGEGLYDRRGGWAYAAAELKLFIDFYRMKFVGLGDLLINIGSRLMVRLMPTGLRRRLYRRFARARG